MVQGHHGARRAKACGQEGPLTPRVLAFGKDFFRNESHSGDLG